MDARAWNIFVKTYGPRSGAFLHSWGWGEFQKAAGHAIKRILETDAACLLVKQPLVKDVHYWYSPRGPIVSSGGVAPLLNRLTEETKGAFAVRFDPPVEGGTVEGKGLVAAPHDVQPRTTILVDLKKSSEALLKEMHHKTRYNIGLADRHDVRIHVAGIEAFDAWWDLLSETAERDQFRPHAKSYYANMLEMREDPDLRIFLVMAIHEGRAVAGAILSDFAGTRTYLHGASSYAARSIMAPQALHWFLIQDAQKKGLRWYDFWGIAPTDDPKEPLAGVTRFKKGFGGEVVRYPKTTDLILRPWRYRAYRVAHRVLIPR